MVKRKRNIREKISRFVHEIDPQAEVFLFGSRARGDENPDSDWDILVLTNYPVSVYDEQNFRHHLIPLELEIGEPFSVFVYSKQDWDSKHRFTPFYQNIANEKIRI